MPHWHKDQSAWHGDDSDTPLEEPYQPLGSRMIWRSPWYALREDTVRFPDGSQGTYTVIEKAGAVYIVPVTDEGQIVLIRNYRYALHRWLWEVPAGGLQPGVAPLEMARRELAEEIGGQAKSLEQVATFYTMPGIGTEMAYVFLARSVTLGAPQHEPGEVMARYLLPAGEVVRMASSGAITDGPSALAILLCAQYLEDV